MTTSGDQRPTGLGWLVDLAVYAPLGLAITLRDDLPRYVETGKQTVAARVQVARWIGEMAVTQGRREFERRFGDRGTAPATPREPSEPMRPTADEVPDEPADALPDGVAEAFADMIEAVESAEADVEADVAAETGVDGTEPSADAPVLDAADLPIEGYESLPALNIVQRLAGLSRSELDAIGRFEAAHRKRRTILAKVEQLQAS